VTPRRGDATAPGSVDFIGDNNNVNNEFGAGETATINNSLIAWPTTPGTPIKTYPPDIRAIQIGSTYSQNVVVDVYNGNGYGIGWISVLRIPSQASGHTQSTTYPVGGITFDPSIYVTWNGITGSNAPPFPLTGMVGNYNVGYHLSPQTTPAVFNSPNEFPNVTPPHGHGGRYQVPLVYSFNSFNGSAFTGASSWTYDAITQPSLMGNAIAPCGLLLFWSTVSTPNAYGDATIEVGHHNSTSTGMLKAEVKHIDEPPSVYTSTREITPLHSLTLISTNVTYLTQYYKDDDINLTQFIGQPMTNAEDMLLQQVPISLAGQAASSSGPVWYIDNYQRPTTVAISGVTRLDSIRFENLEWNYRVNYVGTEERDQDFYNGVSSSEYTAFYPRNTQQCNSGRMFAYVFDPFWDEKGIFPGDTKLDAAVQLINGAQVCVSGHVQDATGAISSDAATDNAATPKPYQETNALVVLPPNDRITLRTHGIFQANIHHERNTTPYPTTDNVQYKATDFPNPDDHIYMYQGASTPHIFNMPGNLGAFQNISSFITSKVIAAPATGAIASIFGVYTDYAFTANMPEIHTTRTHDPIAPYAPLGVDNNPGVIEIGPSTAGKVHFHVYSGGMLKNFEDCTANTNFNMLLGTASGGMPNFYIDNTADLSILNYGNNGLNFCDAKITLQAGAMAVIQPAIETAAGTGAFRVQALSDVVVQEDVNITKTGQGNNIYVLSDGGNVIAEKQVNIASDYVDAVGSGLITFWAEDKNDVNFALCANTVANRNSLRGNVFLKDNSTFTRKNVSTSGTELNIVAANNVRSANVEFSSANKFNDITNIISRKGDVYLGYSKDEADIFDYTISDPLNAGALNIRAGFDDTNMSTSPAPLGGGNIYFTSIDAKMIKDGAYPANLMIPYSLQYVCNDIENPLYLRKNVPGSSMQDYEHAGIIGGLGRCGYDHDFTNYGGRVEGAAVLGTVTVPSLKFVVNNGELLLDAGLRGNIIMNTGTDLDFQTNSGNGFFRTRKGDIDMRGITKITNLPTNQGVVFLADNGNPNKKQIDCGCDEQSNNVYIQDFDFTTFNSSINNGSIYFGADNNIKLQYGGLRDVGTWQDPFLSEDQGYGGSEFGLCYRKYHCDSDPKENHAQVMRIEFNDATGKTSGGVGIVASDQIDIYKDLYYDGEKNSTGMAPVPSPVTVNPYVSNAPTDGRLHGESVAGYGLYIKTQGNKNNWKDPDFSACGVRCGVGCGNVSLQQVARLTFHSDVTINAGSSKVYVSSPVVDVIGKMELDAKAASQINIQTDSLILREQFLLDGTKTTFNTWSTMPRNMPVIKFGNSRYTPPFSDDCVTCFTHQKGTGSWAKHTAVDTINVQFWNNANLPRLHSLVVDHAVLAFGTDSIDNVTG
ncbi:MAG: hypothetical protein LBE56_02010, partial [Tannerella sp.]|nr:hypothetical protein [Tannerella sp.]